MIENGTVGIHIGGAATNMSANVLNNEIITTDAANTSAIGIRVQSAQQFNILNNYFQFNTTGGSAQLMVRVDKSDSGTIVGNYFLSSSSLDYGISSTNANAKNIFVTANTFSGFNNEGINMTAGTNWNIGTNNDAALVNNANYLELLHVAASSSPSITAAGSDTNIDITLTPKGSGNVDVTSAVDVASGSDYQINSTSVLNATTLGSGVTSSSLTSVGTLAGLTATGTIDFGGADSVEIPSGTAPTVNAAGEIAIDTDGDGSTITHGVMRAYDGTNELVFFGTKNTFPSSDNDVLAYDSASNSLTWQAQTGGSGINNVVEDVTPQLGGALDVNSQEIQSLSSTDIVLHSDNDVNVILGDAAGVDDFNVKDSASATVASITSDGTLNIASGQDYQIAGTSVLNASTLGSGVTASSLTSVGTLTSLDVDNINLNGNTISTTAGGEVIVEVGNNNDWSMRITNTDSTNPYGPIITFSGASPDNNTEKFMQFTDTTTNRCIIYSDGDLQNHDNSYGAISDGRLKTGIRDANSQLADIRDIPIKKYKAISDGQDAVEHIGVVAQEIMENNPGLVSYDEELDVYSVQYSVLYMKAVKALQELILKVESIDTRLQTIENKA
jgi:hypothetical protein